MKTFVFAFLLPIFGMPLALPQAQAQTATPDVKQAVKKTSLKKAVRVVDEDDKKPDIAGSMATECSCDQDLKLTIYRNEADDKHIALRWNKSLHRLTRVETTTGANRYENRKSGLVWIDIPAKGMLLDSKKGRQLANECKSQEQMMEKSSEAGKN